MVPSKAVEVTAKTPLLPARSEAHGLGELVLEEWRSIFQRPKTSRPSKLACLDGVRFLAFFWVVSYHALYSFEDFYKQQRGSRKLAAIGWHGVAVFLALSGFLMSRSLNRVIPEGVAGRDCDAVGRWGAGRFLRIWPALAVGVWWSLLIQSYVVGEPYWSACGYDAVAFEEPGERAAEFGRQWWHFTSLVSNLWPEGATCPGAVFWSVGLECQFYAAAPLVALVRSRSRGAATALAAAVFVGCVWARIALTHRLVLHPHRPREQVHLRRAFEHPTALSDAMYRRPWYRASEFAAGVLAYHASAALEDTTGPPRAWLRGAVEAVLAGAVVAYGVIVAMYFWYARSYDLESLEWAADHPWVATYVVACAPPAAAVLTAAFTATACSGDASRASAPVRCVRTALEHPAWYPLAALSYTAYLMSSVGVAMQFRDAPLYDLPTWRPYESSFNLRVLVNAALALALGLVLSVTVERPVMAAGRFLLRRPSPSPGPPQKA